MTTRLYGDPRRCPVVYDPGGTGRAVACGGVVRAGMLMCPPHWRRVPKDVRAAVSRASLRWQREPTDEAWAVLTQARETALAVFARG